MSTKRQRSISLQSSGADSESSKMEEFKSRRPRGDSEIPTTPRHSSSYSHPSLNGTLQSLPESHSLPAARHIPSMTARSPTSSPYLTSGRQTLFPRIRLGLHTHRRPRLLALRDMPEVNRWPTNGGSVPYHHGQVPLPFTSSPTLGRSPAGRPPLFGLIDAADPFNVNPASRILSSVENPFSLQESTAPASVRSNGSLNMEGGSSSSQCCELPESDAEYLPDSPCPQSRSQRQRQSLSPAGNGSKKIKGDNAEHTPICEFSTPCRMGPSPDGMHYRKVVSHVFGRNKASTKLFPDIVWVYFCRKHYQRARYRADQWPFTQCDLLLESLSRIEEWKGVKCFELTLRRREVIRRDEVNANGDSSNDRKSTQAPGASRPGASRTGASRPGAGRTTNVGRRHPTAVTAPVPQWLHDSVGPNKSFAEIRAIVHRIREHLAGLRQEETARDAERAAAESQSVGNGSRRGGKGNRDATQNQVSQVRFPDVEILPVFKDWVLQAGIRKRGQTEDNENDLDAEDTNNDGADERHEEKEEEVEEEEEEEEEEEKDHQEVGCVASIGRAGTNRGTSSSQRRRNNRHWIEMVGRVSDRGAVKKPSNSKKKRM